MRGGTAQLNQQLLKADDLYHATFRHRQHSSRTRSCNKDHADDSARRWIEFNRSIPIRSIDDWKEHFCP